MAIADAASVDIAYAFESQFNTAPAEPYILWRLTQRNINAERETLRTAEVGTAGMTDAGVHGIQNNVGHFGAELGLVKQDHLLAWMLGHSSWTTATVGDTVDTVQTKTGLTIAKSYGAAANKHRVFTGCAVQRATLRAGVRQIPTIDFDVVATTLVEASSSGLLTGVLTNPTAAPTNESFSPFVGQIDIGTLTDRKICTGIELNINCGYEFAHGMFSRNPQDVLKGNYAIDGALTVHLDATDFAALDAYGYTEQTAAVTFQFSISATVYLKFYLPAVKFWPITDDPPQQGLIPVQMRFEASRGALTDPVATTLLRVRRKNT